MKRGGAIYIICNKHRTTFYTGVTEDLLSRIAEHRDEKYSKSFSARYNCNRLVYYELFHSIEEAIVREKQIKSGSRKRKIELIESMNPNWEDLFEKIKHW